MAYVSGEQVIATILKHDTKTTSYKMALLRAINDVVLMYPDMARKGQAVAVPLSRIATLWAAYYWPFVDEQLPIYQKARSVVNGQLQNDISFRPALSRLRLQWQQEVQLTPQAADGFFLLTEMSTPRRRATYSATLQQTYKLATEAITGAIQMPIRHSGPGEWTVFDKPARLDKLAIPVVPLPSTQANEVCLVITADLWQAFHRLSLYIEALCLHEWCLFTEKVPQDATHEVTRGVIYTLLTARPDNRRPLSWERNQVDILLLEQVPIFCLWTGRRITQPAHYDLDHLLPLKIYPINELWNVLPVDKEFNQRRKRDRIPKTSDLFAAQPRVAAAYTAYHHSTKLRAAIHEDAALRFVNLTPGPSFADSLAQQALSFIDNVATARFATRF
ncbi:hypothetical protein [Hymenobacter cavernae]|uniref:HNH nuclease domain-containing protein n=1 Tax=Hymenobacter cavernae TaxID=2044852 RepID=A0ABQ1UUJ4_9BACT|nr:hypothetical protein [Hymenobacter cavernae]GGF27473.1 hypothetical protein GCM10011383_43960 [Hymenobacter cavernae]